jgi:hypothetical protein
VQVLVEAVQAQVSASLVECSVCALRNLCINCAENQEELSRQNGMLPLLQLLHSCTRRELLDAVAATLVKVCLAALSSNDPARPPVPSGRSTHAHFGGRGRFMLSQAWELVASEAGRLYFSPPPLSPDTQGDLAGVLLVSSKPARDPDAVRRAQLARYPRRRQHHR